MKQHFENISERHNLLKIRTIFLSSVICSPVFYYFMKWIEVGSIDSLSFRLFISFISLIAFWLTFENFPNKKKTIFYLHIFARACWMILYLYLLHINHWTLYQRWSYFVLAFMLCGSSFSWKDYLVVMAFSIASPIILSFFAIGISPLEILHFHTALIAPLIIIGFSIKAHFHFKNEVELLNRGLIEKSQMSVLNEVAAGVSHEMNSPLMIMSYSLHQLKRQLELEIPDKKRIDILTEKMHRMIERIASIVNALKVYSVEANDDKLEEVNLLSLIDESLVLCNRKFAEQGINVTYERNELDEIKCYVKKSQIIQCFLNLFNNAIDACQNIPSPQIAIDASVKTDCAHIAISDNGNGVAEEFASKIMNPFFTTKEFGPGLGLSISHGIARGHRGELFLDRELAATTFVLKIPLA